VEGSGTERSAVIERDRIRQARSKTGGLSAQSARQQMQFRRLLVAIGILGYLFAAIPVAQVFQVLERAQFPWLLAAFLLALVVQVVTAKRLKILADAHNLGLTGFHVSRSTW
jgi:hypothetical protein